ncbi:hypothetical protein F5X68DRAFT_49339 [Plectosphaerella plurivora]|uniref:Uncharacterized protein n=1 Tax=Plectosphaerella plurivora TaxID=936078 RepID=A0A9P8VL21_9PEZI|nr:hypothetical protein F5X68DRAFT_49339 [Plectosphaerella plurivora]
MDLTTPSSAPSIFKRCLEVKSSLNHLHAAVDEEPRDDLSIKKDDIGDHLDRFLLWAGSLGALRDPKSRLSLDQRLSSTPEVREKILRRFANIEEAIEDLQAILSRDRPTRQMASAPSSPSGNGSDDDDEVESLDDESDADDEAHMMLEIISESIKTLFKIAVIIRKSGTRDRFSKALQMSTSSFSDVHDIDYVRQRHPKLRQHSRPESVTERLGSAISKRRQFIAYVGIIALGLPKSMTKSRRMRRQSWSRARLQPFSLRIAT